MTKIEEVIKLVEQDLIGMFDRPAYEIAEIGGEIIKLLSPVPVAKIIKRTLQDDSGDEAVYADEVFYDCPCCGQRFSRRNKDTRIKYCWACGQAVSWDIE